MHCNSLRTACFVVLEHFVFTTVVCALHCNRRWGRVARVSHALCSQIQVFPTWRIVFWYSLCFLFVFVFSDWGPIVSCFTHFVSHSVPDTPCFEKQAIQMSLTHPPVLFGKNKKIPPQKILVDELFLKWDFFSLLFFYLPLIFLSDVWMFELLTSPLTLQAWTHCFLLWHAIDNN